MSTVKPITSDSGCLPKLGPQQNETGVWNRNCCKYATLGLLRMLRCSTCTIFSRISVWKKYKNVMLHICNMGLNRVKAIHSPSGACQKRSWLTAHCSITATGWHVTCMTTTLSWPTVQLTGAARPEWRPWRSKHLQNRRRRTVETRGLKRVPGRTKSRRPSYMSRRGSYRL